MLKRYKYYFYTKKNTYNIKSPDSLLAWRNNLYFNLLMYFLPIALVIYMPSVIVSIMFEEFAIAFFDTFSLLTLIYLVLNNNMLLITHKVIFTINIYILSFVLVVYLGIIGPGALYLTAISVISVLIIGPKTGFITVGINFLIYLIMTLSFIFPNVITPYITKYSLVSWVAVAINLIGINFLIVLSLGSFIKNLEKSIKNEKKLKYKLSKRASKLKEEKDKAEKNALNLLILKNRLEESEEKLRIILENSADSIYILDRSGHFVFINDNGLRYLEYSKEELQNYSIKLLSPENDLSKNSKLLKKILTDGKLNAEINLQRKSGLLLPLDIHAVLIPNGLVYLSCRDITKRKKAEKKIIKQLNELRSWQNAMFNRENRVLDLKNEINELLIELGKPVRYTSIVGENLK
jgi:PAS domain S-box-containing protein